MFIHKRLLKKNLLNSFYQKYPIDMWQCFIYFILFFYIVYKNEEKYPTCFKYIKMLLYHLNAFDEMTWETDIVV